MQKANKSEEFIIRSGQEDLIAKYIKFNFLSFCLSCLYESLFQET